jgi:hypothetical protein
MSSSKARGLNPSTIDAKQVATTVTMGILQLPVVGELFPTPIG